ncbi:uncharacterized protein LAESUDRAFT_738283 [Laetiporus sulphureus 93-53]|uniref:Kinetochore protein mis14 n=1 Tax=Laetiporus sulphureus 93-53 TaxID=1314785 RepID=A0A165CTS9_9APHY|nr:uncharacterized protein LAESUDRAFT_738283 [Laetiporus sulphureus 93-53]KZT03421.1 hypothetical protein LAESUDRAFT_738283 [Laetiporus sulphureus 93-53]
MDDQREDISRISVDTVQDWQRIKANYTRAAMAILDEELAQGGPSEERGLIAQHLKQFVDRTFEKTRPNIRVNGRNAEDVDVDEEEEEPFDEGFDRHIWALSEQSLKWDKELAARRQKHPVEVERLLEELLNRQRAVDEELAAEGDGDGDTVPLYNDLPPDAYENIEQITLKLNAITDELNQSVPLQLERSERVQDVAATVKTLKP